MKYSTVKEYARELRKNQTKAEAFVWQRVRNRRFQGLKFNRQYIIQHSTSLNKSQYFIADFYCHEKRLIIEIDGEIHKFQAEYDRIRESILKDLGYRVIRFSNNQILNNWPDVEKEIVEYIHSPPAPL